MKKKMMMIMMSTATTSILLFSNPDRRYRAIVISMLLTNISDKSNVVLKITKPEPIITAGMRLL